MLSLDGLRGLAILLVMMMHFVRPEGEGLIRQVAGTGWIGVDLFFVLSGFLITGILLDTKSASGYYQSFYLRRMLRIFPLYYLFLTVILLLPASSAAGDMLGRDYLAQHQWWFWPHMTNWLMVVEGSAGATAAGFGAIWSLSIEEQFYLVWPLAVASLSSGALRRLCLGVVILSLPLRAVLAWWGVGEMTLYHATFTRADALAVGALVAIGARHRGVVHVKPLMATLTIAAAIAAAMLVLAASFNTPSGNALRYAGVASALATGWGSVLIITLTSPGRWARWMEGAFLRFFGKHSYALYLLQAPVDHFLVARVGPDVLGWVAYATVGAALTTLLAVATWYLWEQPFLSLKRFVPRSLEGAPVAMPVP